MRPVRDAYGLHYLSFSSTNSCHTVVLHHMVARNNDGKQAPKYQTPRDPTRMVSTCMTLLTDKLSPGCSSYPGFPLPRLSMTQRRPRVSLGPPSCSGLAGSRLDGSMNEEEFKDCQSPNPRSKGENKSDLVPQSNGDILARTRRSYCEREIHAIGRAKRRARIARLYAADWVGLPEKTSTGSQSSNPFKTRLHPSKSSSSRSDI